MSTFKILHGDGPLYLKDLLSVYTPGRQLRSSEKLLLAIPRVKRKTLGERSFAHGASKLWNDLPAFIRECDTIETFKSLLKTELFSNAYDC